MLRREYGIATPSPLAPPIHPEDAQPNEAINKRARKLPPTIRPTAPPVVQSSGSYSKGGSYGHAFRSTLGNVSQRGQFTQHSSRGSSSWRGRGTNGHTAGPPSWRGERRADEKYSAPSGPRDSGWANRPSQNSRLGENGSANRPVYGQTNRGHGPLSGLSTAPHFSAPIDPRHSQPTRSNWATQRPKSHLPSSTPTSPRFKRRKLEQRPQPDIPAPSEEEPRRPVSAKPGSLVPSTRLSPSNASVPDRCPLPPSVKKEEPSSASIPPPPPVKVETGERSHIKLEATTPVKKEEPFPVSIPPRALVKIKKEEASSIKLEVTTSQELTSIPTPPAIPIKAAEHEVTSTKLKDTSAPQSAVKLERLSPSPPPERRLITKSCNFYPFPDHCKKSSPNFRENRRALFLEKNRELVQLGLRKTKVFSRDDGLVIEWTSKVPVWSDTFSPDRPDDFTNVIEISD